MENLCEVHAPEAGVGGSRPPFGGGGLFDEFFGRFFDDERATMTGAGSDARRAEARRGGRNR